LADKYIIASISFEGIGNDPFETEESFCSNFKDILADALEFTSISEKRIEQWSAGNPRNFKELSRCIAALCKNQKVVLFIDEVDKTSNNQVFLGFLGLLRTKYLAGKSGKDYTFHSVVLAGVNDIKTIKLKLVRQGEYTLKEGEGSFNSPWNIAVDFTVDMSFNPEEISTMLRQYEDDHNTGMDIPLIAQGIYAYTGGYPFLVSRVCQTIDEKLGKSWTADGIQEAVKIILGEDNTLFANIYKTLENDPELYRFIYSVVITGVSYEYNRGNPKINEGALLGILLSAGGRVAVSNQIFELILANYFISKNATDNPTTSRVLPYDIIQDGKFDMELCLRKFAEHYAEIYREKNSGFLEEHGRLLFLTYLKPLINGLGFYHIESELTDLRRMDLVIDFAGEQFIIELKIWHGDTAHEKAYAQLASYLESRRARTGYLLTFDFRKSENRRTKAAWTEFEGKRIFDVIV
jgi:hypothetical protein